MHPRQPQQPRCRGGKPFTGSEIRTERRELISWLRKGWSQEPFDIVYFDPPYDQGLYEPCLIALAEGNWLHQDSLVVCEHRSNLNPEPGSDWKWWINAATASAA